MNELRVPDPFALDPIDDVFRNLMRPWRMDLASQVPQIKIDLSETDDKYTVKAEIPGVKKEDIDVRIDGSLVSIGAEVKNESQEKKDGRVLRSERRYGYASRSFTLASEVDDSKSEARYENGVLQLVLPKKAGTASKKLAIG